MSIFNELPVLTAYAVNAGLHAGTVRVTYTVPVGQRAEIRLLSFFMGIPAGPLVNQVTTEVRVNGIRALFSGNLGGAETITQAVGFVLTINSGDIVTITTANANAAVVLFVGSIIVAEFQ